MKFKIYNALFSAFFVLLAFGTMAQLESSETKKYFTTDALRDNSNVIYLQKGTNNGVKIMGMADANGSPGGYYQIEEDSSNAYGKDIYVGYGVYMVTYDEDSFVMLVPNETVTLGYGVWETFSYANFCSTDKSKAKSMTAEKAKQWAVDLSKQIMTSGMGAESTPVDTNSTEYYPILKKTFIYGGEEHSKVNIVHDKKVLKISSLNGDSYENYYYKPDYSKAVGVDVYGDDGNRSEVVFVESPSSVVVVHFRTGVDIGLGEYSSDYDKVEYYHKNQQTVRQLLVNETEQDKVENRLVAWTKKAVDYQKTK